MCKSVLFPLLKAFRYRPQAILMMIIIVLAGLCLLLPFNTR